MPPIYAGDAKEDIVVSGTASYGFESRPAYHMPEWRNAVYASVSKTGDGNILRVQVPFRAPPHARMVELGRHAGLRSQFLRKKVRVRVPLRAPSYASGETGRHGCSSLSVLCVVDGATFTTSIMCL